MKHVIVAEVAVIALVGLLTVSSAVNAAETSNRDCWAMANQVKAALAEKPNADQTAWNHYRTGTDACTKGFNAYGVSHLRAALKALGG